MSKKLYSRARLFWRRYKKNKAGVVSIITLLIIMFIGLAAPFIARDPFRISVDVFLPPNPKNIFGTDDIGRDVFSQVVYGIRTSLVVGFLTSLMSTVIGLLAGAVAGYYGGRIDDLLMRISEIFQVIPRFFLALVLVSIFGPSIWNMIIAIGLLTWTESARLTRSQFLSLKEQPFVEAARLVGFSDRKIIFSEILPNAWPPIIVNSSFQVGHAVVLEAGLSFLGVGDPSFMSCGYILSVARQFFARAWWLSVFPGLVIFLIVLGTNLVGETLNDALNPRLKER